MFGYAIQTIQESEEPSAGRHPVLIADGAGYIGSGALWTGLWHKQEKLYARNYGTKPFSIKIRSSFLYVQSKEDDQTL